MFDALLHQGSTLILLCGFILIATGLGYLPFLKSRITFASSSERIFYSAGIGLAILGWAVFLLGALQLYNKAFLYGILIIAAALSFAGWWSLMAGDRGLQGFPKRRSRWDHVADLILAVCFAAALLMTMTPETQKDALIYHLAVPKLFLDHGGFYFIPGNIFSNYPLQSEMLYVIGLFLQGDILAKEIHFAILLCILLGIYQFSRYRTRDNAFPALSMLVLFGIPSVFVVSHAAYNDLFVTLYSMGAVLSFINWFESQERGWLILCGFFSGIATGSKYTALILPFTGCLGILWASWRYRSSPWRAFQKVGAYAVITLLSASPFYVKNWVLTGNPFYPFLFGIFGAKGWEPEQARLYDLFVHNLGMGRGFLDYLLLPWNLSFHSQMDSPRFDGIMGPLFIFTIPFVAGVRKLETPYRIMMVYCAVIFLFWASSAQQIRYLIPVFPFLAILTGVILTYYKRKNKTIFGILVILITAGLIFNGYYITRHFSQIAPAGVAFGLESRDAFLDRRISCYPMLRFINRHLPPDSKILMVYMKNYGFLCDRNFYSDSIFEYYTLQKILSHAHSAADIRKELRERKFTHILYDGGFLFGEPSNLTPKEKDLFLTFQREHLFLIKRDGNYFLCSID
ncbi:MAG: ArnT family glycosyltransferase [Syntrophales bacterium]